jgi:hypothetical protein
MTESDALVVHVQTTPDDGAALCTNLQRAAQPGQLYRFAILFALLWFVFAVALGPDLLVQPVLNRLAAVVISLVVGIIPLLVVFYLTSHAHSTKMYDPKGLFLRPHQISVSSDGVSFKSDVANLKYHWSAFLRLEETPSHFFLYPDKLMAYVIPKRHFANAEEAARFGATVRAHIEPAQPSA